MNKFQIWVCKHFHAHEKYNECVDPNGMYGPYYEHGVHCKDCGRKWDDPEEKLLAERRWREDASKHYSVNFGTTDTYIMSFSGEWQDVEMLHSQYDCVREVLLRQEKEDIGDIKDKFFVFCDDCKPLKPPINNPNFPDLPWRTEWELLANWPGIQKPMMPEALAAWTRRKLTYEQAVEKVKNTVRNESYLKPQKESLLDITKRACKETVVGYFAPLTWIWKKIHG